LSSTRLFTNLIARFKGQQVSQQERDSIAYFTDKLMLSTSLMNDLYSFHKEFEEHSASGNIETIGNVMALLMSGYGYEEEEAASIVKQEILIVEKQGLEEFHAWHSSNLEKSPNLVGYAFTVLAFLGGMNYWMSHSERYFRTDLRTTAKDRASLVRNSASGVRRLKNYPAPQAFNDPDTSILGICSIFPGSSDTNGIQRNGQEAASEALVDGGGCTDVGVGITENFQKDDSEKACYNFHSGFNITNEFNSCVWPPTTTSALSLVKELWPEWLTRCMPGSASRPNLLRPSKL
jgi:hypothetical protein